MAGDKDELRAAPRSCCRLPPPPLNMAKIGFIFFAPAAEVLCETDLALLTACRELTMSDARGEKSVKIPSPEEQFL